MEQQSATFSSNNQMPPLGPAPAQLPPVVHPPRQTVTNGTNSVGETKVEPAVPIQTQFESLSLNTPLQPPTGTDLSQDQFSSVQINNELSGTQESIDDNSNDNDATINPTGELSLTNEDGTRGMYYNKLNNFFFIC
jgi:hypothetical protein